VSLAHRQEQVLDELKEHLCVIAARHPVGDLSRYFEEAEECFEALACCHLLVHADRQKLQKHLSWAARSRWHFLTRCNKEQVEDHRQARSRSNAVFCALAAGDVALAREVSALAPTAWIPDGEYEDDFAYHMAVHALLTGAGEDTALAAYDTLSTGLPRERFEVLAALVTRDASAFDEAFVGLCDAQAALVKAELPMHQDHASFEPRAQLFVEGLGLLRLAELRGVTPPALEYPPLCPSLARVPLLAYPVEDILASL
jgi:hypothetical protein